MKHFFTTKVKVALVAALLLAGVLAVLSSLMGTTVGDVLKFWDALLGDRLLSADMRREMLTVHARDGGAMYGYGIWMRPDGAQFEGCDPGVSFVTRWNRETGAIAAVVSNYGDNVWKMIDEIME